MKKLVDYKEFCEKMLLWLSTTKSDIGRYLNLKAERFPCVVGRHFWMFGTPSKIIHVAHIDTVASEEAPALRIYEDGDIVRSGNGVLGADDRVGCTILEFLLDSGATVLFTDLEERGGVGAQEAAIHPDLKEYFNEARLMIEYDREGVGHYVDYNKMSQKTKGFIKEIAPGLKEECGTFSDISILTEVTRVPSFNLACGYYKQHTSSEFLVMQSAYLAYKIGVRFEDAKEKVPFSPDEHIEYDYINFDYSNKRKDTKRSKKKSDTQRKTLCEYCLNEATVVYLDEYGGEHVMCIDCYEEEQIILSEEEMHTARFLQEDYLDECVYCGRSCANTHLVDGMRLCDDCVECLYPRYSWK